MKLPRLPLCETMPTGPATGNDDSSATEKVAMLLSGTPIAPRQLGPTTRMPVDRATSPIWACRRLPSSPISENPADRMTAAFTPRRAQSFTASSTPAGGTAITASSGTSGTSSRLA